MKTRNRYQRYSRRLTRQRKTCHRLFCLAVTLCLFLCVTGILTVWFSCTEKKPPVLSADPCECDGFRSMRLTPELTESLSWIMSQTDTDKYQLLAVLMAATNFNDTGTKPMYRLPSALEDYDELEAFYKKRYPDELATLAGAYQIILSDIVYFPVMQSSREKDSGISYENAWLAERNYQNVSHSHEGTDIMALNNRRGYYPIVSMTDGIVENIGWLEKGGYRVGIRSPHGGYFYYAHLYRYAEGLEKGDTVQAGELLGFMGDSGYSRVEGTVGNFDVHLHLGIYLGTSHYEELSVNPYWILKLMEDQTVIGDY